jgi:hypothetical protein
MNQSTLDENEGTSNDPYQHSTGTRFNEENFELVVEEAQATIVRQNDMMEHIDDRALNLVRTAQSCSASSSLQG